ncbi:hypothetical protein BpHYR1_029077 [Brachionus plicatilis]|uniref:Uncharacterized protein n=1 Tax=Brachionus plicatilis TaxID=10195 RepID=A0A3M7RQ07_BRAPC|nr:hypothetical protein BpHYR1_029077 [Brachionus plicatilis]
MSFSSHINYLLDLIKISDLIEEAHNRHYHFFMKKTCYLDNIKNVYLKKNGSKDCGFFALGYALALALDIDPVN